MEIVTLVVYLCMSASCVTNQEVAVPKETFYGEHAMTTCTNRQMELAAESGLRHACKRETMPIISPRQTASQS